jgi:hypothetical protein
MKIYLIKDRRGKPYFLRYPKQLLNVETAHRHFPSLIGIKTAEAMQKLKTQDVVEVEV